LKTTLVLHLWICLLSWRHEWESSDPFWWRTQLKSSQR